MTGPFCESRMLKCSQGTRRSSRGTCRTRVRVVCGCRKTTFRTKPGTNSDFLPNSIQQRLIIVSQVRTWFPQVCWSARRHRRRRRNPAVRHSGREQRSFLHCCVQRHHPGAGQQGLPSDLEQLDVPRQTLPLDLVVSGSVQDPRCIHIPCQAIFEIFLFLLKDVGLVCQDYTYNFCIPMVYLTWSLGTENTAVGHF